MDNLINNALAGLPSLTDGASGMAASASVAMQWQQQLVTPALAMTITPAVVSERNAVVDTSSVLALQQLLTPPSDALSEAVVQPQAEADVSGLKLINAGASLAFNSHISLSVTQTTVTSAQSGQKTQLESRLLSWGNAGQGVLSYISADIHGNTITSASHLELNTAAAATAGVQQSVADLPPLKANQSLMTPSSSSVGQVSTRQITTQQKSSDNALQQNQKLLMGYDIAPQALFFVLTGQQGYRATVRDYFSKEDTLKRLYQLHQDNTFGFSSVQEIWLNGKPISQQRQQEAEHAG